MENKYVKLENVKALLSLIKTRDSFHDWTNEYEKYDRKVKNTIEWLERNAKTFDDGNKKDDFDEDFYQNISYDDFRG